MRENTERPITVEQGTNTLVGRDRRRALECVDALVRSGGKRGRMPELWDGRAADRIAAALSTWLGAPAGDDGAASRLAPLEEGGGPVRSPA
jgi:UDP-N-acetylglucosamine 2-epimerase (non-hydrolysing)